MNHVEHGGSRTEVEGNTRADTQAGMALESQVSPALLDSGHAYGGSRARRGITISTSLRGSRPQ